MATLLERHRRRIKRSEELVNDRDKITQLMLKAEDNETFQALDLLHLLITESYQKVTGVK